MLWIRSPGSEYGYQALNTAIRLWIRSPGTKYDHYAPNTITRLWIRLSGTLYDHWALNTATRLWIRQFLSPWAITNQLNEHRNPTVQNQSHCSVTLQHNTLYTVLQVIMTVEQYGCLAMWCHPACEMCRPTEISKGCPDPALLPNYSILKMKAAGISEPSAPFYKNTGRDVPADSTIKLPHALSVSASQQTYRNRLRFSTCVTWGQVLVFESVKPNLIDTTGAEQMRAPSNVYATCLQACILVHTLSSSIGINYCRHLIANPWTTLSNTWDGVVLTWRALGQRQVTLGGSSGCPGDEGCGGHTALEGAEFPYCATWMEMLVPCGHLRVTTSLSQPAFW